MASPNGGSRSRRVAIACQGGGSHTAFTAGALRPLLREAGRGDYQICAFTGTSGGALCAALAWYGLVTEPGTAGHQLAIRLLDEFWRDNSAQSPWEQWFNSWTISLIQMHMQGRLPELKGSPYSPQHVLSIELLKTLAPRSEFFDLRALIEKYIDLRQVTQPVADPRLLIGAVGVLSGKFKAFDSKAAEISIDAILASTTLPNLFQAIKIGEEIYWDGLFSQNPPVRELVSNVDVALKPDEIWIIRINPQSISQEPRSVEEIEDRRNAGRRNLSLTHEVEVIERISQWLREGRFKSDHAKPITFRWIQMSAALSDQLGYVSKLNRDPAHLNRLIADGEAQAEAFLTALPAPEAALV